MQWSDEMIQKTKDHFVELYGVELSTEDAIESLNNMATYLEIVIDWYESERTKEDHVPCFAHRQDTRNV